MAALKPEITDRDNRIELSLLEKLLGFALYFLMSLVIFLAPFYLDLPGIVSIAFFAFGGIFLYASIVSLLVRLAESAAGSSEWDRKGLITVASIWCWGVLSAFGPSYFNICSDWRYVFYYAAAIVLVIGLAGSIYELTKRESKGAGWYWVPGLAWLIASLILHFVQLRMDAWPVLKVSAGFGALFCFLGCVFFLLPIIPYHFPTLKPRIKLRKHTLRSLFRNTPRQDEAVVSDQLQTNVSIVIYRLMIILYLFSILMIILVALS